ncbi:uncharacterized protein LOC109432555 isoform X2 [Aedes albopictus]|uniref:Tudor domain-containing protein 1 n=1 Tax=Aedes albopictus TaxID=7160 RepID=A0ABM1XK60_AEDAL
MNIMKKCGFCQQPAGLMCSRCLEVYCSVECQIRDWSEHKKVCIVIPKLYPNDSYLDVLASGVTLPLRSSSLIEQASSRMLANNGRSLRPLRKPNFPMGSVEASVGREATASLPDGCDNEQEDKVESNGSVSNTVSNITVSTSDCEKRMSKMKIEEIGQNGMVKESAKPKNPVGAEKPQSLANLKLEMIKNHKKYVENCQGAAAALPAGGAPPSNKQRNNWLLHFPLEKADGEPFEVIVQYVVANRPNECWVISADHETQCDKLLRDINGQINPKGDPIKYDDVQVDDIYAAPYEGLYYRVVILEKVDEAKSLVKVRLIDYGNEANLPASDLRAPLTLMKNLRAFAFLIEIRNLNRPLKLTETIRIGIVRSEADRKIVDIDLGPTSLLELLGKANQVVGEGGIVAILSSRKALILLSSEPVMPIMKILYTQMPEAAAKFPKAENVKVGDLVCVEIEGVGWSRAQVMEQHDRNRIVYTIDNGTVELVNAEDMRSLPDEYMNKPRLVLQVDLTNVVMNEQEFKRLCYMPSFAFSFERLSYDKQQRRMKCLMKDVEAKRTLAEVEFGDFVCDLKTVGINYWPNIPQDKSIVKISSVLDVGTVIICPKGKVNVYTELLQSVMPTLTRLTAVPNVKDVVVAVDDVMMPYRARVLSIPSPKEVEVLDLDNGHIRKTPLQNLYTTNGFVNNLPVYTVKVQIRDMNVSAIKDQACVLDQLDAFRTGKREFRMMFEGGSYMYGVKLIDLSTSRSLVTILMEHHDKKLREVEEAAKKKQDQEEAAKKKREQEEAAKKKREQEEEDARRRAKEATEAKAKQEEQRLEAERKAAAQAAAAAAAARAEQERKDREEQERKKKAEAEASAAAAATATVCSTLKIDDLQLIPLPAGKSDVKLTILDDSDLAQGAITVCEVTEQNVKRYATLTDEVNKLAGRCGGDGYAPKLDELCIAIFDLDKMWYRAVCIEPQPENNIFLLQFIDYGNVATVKRESIRTMPKELAFPCAAHTCIVKDAKKVVATLLQQQTKQGYVVAQEIKSEGEIYSLKF